MAEIFVTLTDTQERVITRLHPRTPIGEIIQTHVDTWLLPLVLEAERQDQESVFAAIKKADAQQMEAVKDALGMTAAVKRG